MPGRNNRQEVIPYARKSDETSTHGRFGDSYLEKLLKYKVCLTLFVHSILINHQSSTNARGSGTCTGEEFVMVVSPFSGRECVRLLTGVTLDVQ